MIKDDWVLASFALLVCVFIPSLLILDEVACFPSYTLLECELHIFQGVEVRLDCYYLNFLCVINCMLLILVHFTYQEMYVVFCACSM